TSADRAARGGRVGGRQEREPRGGGVFDVRRLVSVRPRRERARLVGDVVPLVRVVAQRHGRAGRASRNASDGQRAGVDVARVVGVRRGRERARLVGDVVPRRGGLGRKLDVVHDVAQLGDRVNELVVHLRVSRVPSLRVVRREGSFPSCHVDPFRNRGGGARRGGAESDRPHPARALTGGAPSHVGGDGGRHLALGLLVEGGADAGDPGELVGGVAFLLALGQDVLVRV